MLIVFALISLSIFVVPVRYKYGAALTVVVLTSVAAGAAALLSLTGSLAEIPLAGNYHHPLFRSALPRMDGLSALFVLLICTATLAVTLYARDYLKAYSARKAPVQLSVHYVALVWMFIAMLAVVIFRGGFAFLAAWETMTIASFALILFEAEKREVRRAAINYLILMHIGFVFLVAGFTVAAGGGLTGFDALRGYFAEHHPAPLFIVFLLGFGMKAGIFPLHIWLPEAHPAAPSHISALMSGVMTKMGVYGVLRVLSSVTNGLETVGLILLGVGLATALWGIVHAALQNDLKKLLAYSTIENIGIVFTGLGAGTLGLAGGNTPLAVLGLTGALLHALNHSLFKPMLFMSAGSVLMTTHTRNLDELGGLSRRMPLTTGLFLVGSAAICALPPLNGFVSEYLIYLGLLRSVAAESMILWSMAGAAVLALVGGIAVLTFGKALGIGFLGAARSAKADRAQEATGLMLAAQMIPLAGIVLIGLFPVFAARWIGGIVRQTFLLIPADVSGAVEPAAKGLSSLTGVAAVVIGLTLLLVWLRSRAQRKRAMTESPTWGCGFTAPNARMQYTGESFSEGLQHLTASPTNTRSRRNRRAESISKEEIFAGEHDFGVRRSDRIDRLVSERWVYLIRKVNARLALFQTGKINHYILHALLFLIFIFLISWIGWV
jgi:formate hydrogenlyase subunit 3/multisubunit Na+/H+ antiporter MnhD subunit